MTVRSEAGRVRISTIGRSIDFQVPTNRAIAFVSLGVFLAGGAIGLVRGATWPAGLLDGLTWAGSVFLAWALTREADPDRWCSAFFAAAGGLAGVILLGPPSFLFLFWFVLGLRAINRTTGAAPGVLDLGALCGISLWLGYTFRWLIPLLAVPTVLFADIRRFPKWLRIALPLALPTAAVILGFTRGWRFVFANPSWGEIGILTAVSAALVPVIASYRSVRSVGDRTGAPLTPHRVQSALGWAAVATLILTLSGTASLQELAPLWAALAGTSIGWAIEKLTRRFGGPL